MAITIAFAIGVGVGWLVFEKPELVRSTYYKVKDWVTSRVK